MGRRSKGVSADPPPNRTIPTVHILPRPDTHTSGLTFLAPSSISTNSGQLIFGKLPLNVNVTSGPQYLHDLSTQLGHSGSPPQKVLLPKLPPGLKPPSKIIFVNGRDTSGKVRVQVLNTSRARGGLTDEERKKKMLTGEINFPSSILPKPEPLLLRRPKTVVVSERNGSISVTQQDFHSVPKVAIPRCNPSPSRTLGNPVKRRRLVSRQIDHDTDAVDGFGDSEDEGVPINNSFTDELNFLRGNEVEVGEPQTSEMPSTSRISFKIAPQSMVIPSDRLYHTELGQLTNTLFGGSGQMVIKNLFPLVMPPKAPNPDDFRPPKRRKLLKKPEKEDLHEKSLNLDDLRKDKRKGRPSFLKKTTQNLIDEINSDCLAVASDGANLKCLACNCLLTKEGWGYPRQILRHLQVIKSHQARYEIWTHQKETDGSPYMHVDSNIPEVTRTRGRYRKTPLDYFAEFNNRWLNVSPDGQMLRCDACNVVLIDLDSKDAKGKRTDVHKHLFKDLAHATNVQVAESRQEEDAFETGIPPADDQQIDDIISAGVLEEDLNS